MKQEKDNELLKKLAANDQSDRAKVRLGEMTVETMRQNDVARLKKVEIEIQLGRIKTIQDHRNAGLIFHHIRNAPHCKDIAVKMLRKSTELNNYESVGIKWLLAAAIDRRLQEQNQPQIYGTQYFQDEEGIWKLHEFDPTKISDKERKKYGVITIDKQTEALRKMNKKQLADLYIELKDINKIEVFCIDNQDNEEFDFSWRAISQFAFYLKRIGKITEAMRMFELAIKLYPQEYDVYHSLGLLYEEIGEIEKAITFIEKSVTINSNFKDGLKDLARLKS